MLNPFDGSLQDRQQWFLEVYAESYSAPNYHQDIAEGLTTPVPRGLVAWANVNEGTVYWDPRTAADPDRWTVVEEVRDYWQAWPLTLTEYILKALTGDLPAAHPVPPVHRS